MQAQFADFVGKAGDLRLLIDFMSPPGAAPWRPEPFCFIAAVPSASTGVTAQDKVDRLEARMAFRAPEPDARPEAAAELDAQREAVAPDAAVVAEPDAQQAVAAVLDAQQAAALGVQREAAVVAKSGAQRAVGPVAVARPLVASVEPAETAAVRFWIPAMMVSAVALERRVVSAAKVQAAADR